MYQQRAFRSLVEQRLLRLYLPTGTELSSHDRARHTRQPLYGTRPLASLCDEIERSDQQW